MNLLDQIAMPILNRSAANPLFDWIMPRVTNLHQLKLFLALVLVLCVAIVWRGSRRAKLAVLCALLAVGLSDLAGSKLIKRIVTRERPCHVAEGRAAPAFAEVRLAPGTHCPGSPSLPSNHAANMMALALVGWRFTTGRKRWLWFLLPVVIGYSRIYLGFHYPTDVLCGYALGALLAAAILALAQRLTSVRPDASPEPQEPAPA